MIPVSDLKVNVNCNIDCHRCCPSFLKFICICCVFRCGAKTETDEKTNAVGTKNIKKDS